MAKRRRDPARERYWRGLISEWPASGLSVREFCRQRSVTEASFYSWRGELQRRDARSASSPPSAFVPVTVVAAGPVEVRCPSGHVVALPSADGDTLRHLFSALALEASC
jgi:transposase-like protein